MAKNCQIHFAKKSSKEIKKMDKLHSLLIMNWIKKNLVNSNDPRQFGKGLVGNHSGEWRYRIGDYRLIADINDETITILILDIGHRRDIY